MTRAEKYRCEFNRLEKILKRKDGASDEKSIRSVVESLARKRGNRVIQQYKEEIIQHIQLRNAIVHQSTNMTVAELHEETIAELRKLREYIERPKTAWDIATKPLVTIALEDDLSHAIRCMAEKRITSLPVIADKKVVGFVSERTIVRAINSAFEIGGAFVDEAKIRDIRYDMPYGDDIDTYGYVSRGATVYDVEDMFSDAIKDKKRLLAILVSDNGTESTMPLGIITAWDLYKIKKQNSELDKSVTTIGWG